MPKKIKRETDIAIKWRPDDQQWFMNARSIGGGRLWSNQKAELQEKRRALFARFSGEPIEDVAPERSWTLNEVLIDYTQLFNDRVANDEDQCGDMHQGTTIARLHKIMAMKLGGIQIGVMDPRHLTIDMMVDELWPALKERTDKGKKIKPLTAANYYNCLQGMLDFCLTKDIVHKNVAKLAKSKQLKKRVIFPNREDKQRENLVEELTRVSPDTIQKILDAIPTHREKLIMLTACQTGLRAGELCMVRIYDPQDHNLGGIDFDNNCIWVEQAKKRAYQKSDEYVGAPKSVKGRRRIPIMPSLSEMLKNYWLDLDAKMQGEGWLFPTTHGTRSDGDNWRNRILYRACKKAGLPRKAWPTWHMLRHVYATSLLTSNGADIIKCTERMGHRDIKTTMIYKHALIDPKADQEEAEEMAGVYGLSIDTKPTTPGDTNVVKFKRTG
ncbi:MAG: site-specific integrase [Betaproteobacteria bacterium]